MGPRIERVRASIKAATFTGKGDDKVVVGCITSITKISNAMVDSGEVQAMYEGEYNAAGEREGYGTIGCQRPTATFTRGSSREVSQMGAARIVMLRRRVRGKLKGVSKRGAARSVCRGHVYEGEWKGVRRGARHVRLPRQRLRGRVQGG